MADRSIDTQLREMAQHRGLKLLKSRRRKAGVGDYGKFGLTDAAGTALLGIGEDGLTASAEDVESYLRADAAGSWMKSAKATPDRPAAKAKAPPAAADDAPPIRRRRPARAAKPAGTPRDRDRGRGREGQNGRLPGTRKVKGKTGRRGEALPSRPPPPQDHAPPKSRRDAPATPLRLRAAKPSDATALAALLSQLDGVDIGAGTVAANLATARRMKGGMIVAEREAVVGCCGWAMVATVHRGPLGRLTVLVVDRDHRRRGVATALVARAGKVLAEAGCGRMEAMSDIAISNAHNFFRALTFEQASYRFVRTPEV